MILLRDLCTLSSNNPENELIDSLPKEGERNVLITSALPCKLDNVETSDKADEQMSIMCLIWVISLGELDKALWLQTANDKLNIISRRLCSL